MMNKKFDRGWNKRANFADAAKGAGFLGDDACLCQSLRESVQYQLASTIRGRVAEMLSDNGSGDANDPEDQVLVPATMTFTLAATDFAPMFTGKITPTNAFMSKKLKIKGDMTKALKLEGVLKKMNKSKL
ncbi:SCP-2 sterol transfer family protein [Teladorsagia circumcincta]|uniref:SCP-2 sterol transfer family protein n=1 Tax=Teladorsagia circumcincta TaxID=45464 RepID=A0A2G9UV33_TELCI|nr:SCP-2 sterol transfer family protein [Teladorsagia circumcincta]